jgi:hypothetical protein
MLGASDIELLLLKGQKFGKESVELRLEYSLPADRKRVPAAHRFLNRAINFMYVQNL